MATIWNSPLIIHLVEIVFHVVKFLYYYDFDSDPSSDKETPDINDYKILDAFNWFKYVNLSDALDNLSRFKAEYDAALKNPDRNVKDLETSYNYICNCLGQRINRVQKIRIPPRYEDQIKLLRNSRAHFNFYLSTNDRTKNTQNLEILRTKLNAAEQQTLDNRKFDDVVIWNLGYNDTLVFCYIMKETDLQEIFFELQCINNKMITKAKQRRLKSFMDIREEIKKKLVHEICFSDSSAHTISTLFTAIGIFLCN